jgi:hypothetical protein
MNMSMNLMRRYLIILFIKNLVNSGNAGAINLIGLSYTINYSTLMASLETLK